MRKFGLALLLFNIVAVGACFLGLAQAQEREAEAAAVVSPLAEGLKKLAAGLAFFGGAIGTALAQSRIGPSVMAAVAEDRANFGPGLVVIAIPETIVVFGLVVVFIL